MDELKFGYFRVRKAAKAFGPEAYDVFYGEEDLNPHWVLTKTEACNYARSLEQIFNKYQMEEANG